MPATQTKQRTKIKVQNDLSEPPKFSVIYINDNVTSFDFVISSLIEIFNYTDEIAAELASTVHKIGQAVVAVLPYEIAEQKTLEVRTLANMAGFPLMVRVEPNI